VTSPNHALPLAVSLGDPAGVGPELIAAAWLAREREGLPVFFVCGGQSVLAAAGATTVPITDPAEAAAAFAHGLPVLAGSDAPAPIVPGQPTTEGSALALASLAQAAKLACSGQAGGMVTGPVSKALIAAHDPGFVGQTEFCADACGAPRDDAVMLLAGPQLKVVPLTVHIALADVPAAITRALILHRTRIVARAMALDFGIAAPRIALTGLNPHAGEAGRMGREEIAVIAPAIAALQAEGIGASGPHPADTLFAPHLRRTYDVAIAMNITLGLPIIRTSPDHGTAFGIAGKGTASAGAVIAAMAMAGAVAMRRNAALPRSA